MINYEKYDTYTYPGIYNIYIQTKRSDPPTFLSNVKEALTLISSREVGERLIKKIGEGKHSILILHKEGTLGFSAPLDSTLHRTRGEGCGTTILISQKITSGMGFRSEEIKIPFFIALAHELIHAYHNSYGKNRRTLTTGRDDIWTNAEELKTIEGLPSKKPYARNKPKISENAIRKEHHLPLSFGHFAYTDSEDLKKMIREAAISYQMNGIFQQTLFNSEEDHVLSPSKID